MRSFRWENQTEIQGMVIGKASHAISPSIPSHSSLLWRHWDSGLISKWRTQLRFMIDVKGMSDWLQNGCISDGEGFVNPGNCGRRRITAKTSIIKAANGSQWWIPGEKEEVYLFVRKRGKWKMDRTEEDLKIQQQSVDFRRRMNLEKNAIHLIC